MFIFDTRGNYFDLLRSRDHGHRGNKKLVFGMILQLHEGQDKLTAIKGAPGMLIEPGDAVTIEKYLDVFVNGQVHKPGNYPYQPGLTVRKLVSTAGGFKDRAIKDSVSIIHEHQEKPAPIKGELGKLVEPGDTVTVEESFF